MKKGVIKCRQEKRIVKRWQRTLIHMGKETILKCLKLCSTNYLQFSKQSLWTMNHYCIIITSSNLYLSRAALVGCLRCIEMNVFLVQFMCL